MKTKKTLIKVLSIGAIFFISGFNFAYVVSVNDSAISAFWKKGKLSSAFPKAYADDDEEDDYRPSNNNTSTNTNTSTPSTTTSASGAPTTSVSTPSANTTSNTTTSTTTSASGTPTTTSSTNNTTVSPTTTSTTTSASGAPTTNEVAAPPKTNTPVVPKAPVAPTVPKTTTPIKTPAPTIKQTTNNVTTTKTQTTTQSQNEKTTVPASNFKDGTYIGVGHYRYPGYSFDYKAEATFSGGKITKARWLNFKEIKSSAYTIEKGNLELQKFVNDTKYTVSTVTGATGTTNAIRDALNDILNQAKLAQTQTVNAPKQPVSTNKTSTTNSVKTYAKPVNTPVPTPTPKQNTTPVVTAPTPAPVPAPTPAPAPSTTTKAS